MRAKAIRAALFRRPGRAAVVVAAFAAVALAAGAASVLAGSSGTRVGPSAKGPVPRAPSTSKGAGGLTAVSGHSYQHASSRPVRNLPKAPLVPGPELEASPNPLLWPRNGGVDTARQAHRYAPNMPAASLTFDGVSIPAPGCPSCYPPDTNGEAGLTQYVQMVNVGFQVFNKTTGAALTPAVDIDSLWSGLGGACELGGAGDPVVLYDQLADRWVITQFATPTGNIPITDECIAVSKSGDATGAYWLYGFHLGSNFFDYPHLGVWPDGYYMSMNVFNPTGTAYLGPQPFVFDRAAMLNGDPAGFLSFTGLGSSHEPLLPADLDG